MIDQPTPNLLIIPPAAMNRLPSSLLRAALACLLWLAESYKAFLLRSAEGVIVFEYEYLHELLLLSSVDRASCVRMRTSQNRSMPIRRVEHKFSSYIYVHRSLSFSEKSGREVQQLVNSWLPPPSPHCLVLVAIRSS